MLGKDGKRYSSPPGDRALDRQKMATLFRDLRRKYDQKLMDALAFVIGGEAVAIDDVVVTQARVNIRRLLGQLDDWCEVEDPYLRLTQHVGLRDKDDFSIQELEAIMAGVKGVTLDMLFLHVPAPVRDAWAAHCGDTFPITQQRPSGFRIHSERELTSLATTLSAFPLAGQFSGKKPYIWSFELGRDIEQADLNDPDLTLGLELPDDVNSQSEKVRLQLPRLIRRATDMRIMPPDLAGILFGDKVRNKMRKPMEDLHLRAANPEWNLYF